MGVLLRPGASGPGGIVPETNQALNNIKAILKQANFSLTDVVQVQVFLTDMNDFPNMNKAYAKFFMEPFPTRAAIEVSKLPKNAKIEITATAAKQS